LIENPHLETDPLATYAGETCDIVIDVKRQHEENVINVGRNVVKTVGENVVGWTTHIVNQYEGFLPTRKKKALISSIIFVVATFWSTVLVDSGLIVYINSLSTPTLFSWPAFVPVVWHALILAICPTGVAYLVRKLQQDK
jgi:hypothetical protein